MVVSHDLPVLGSTPGRSIWWLRFVTNKYLVLVLIPYFGVDPLGDGDHYEVELGHLGECMTLGPYYLLSFELGF